MVNKQTSGLIYKLTLTEKTKVKSLVENLKYIQSKTNQDEGILSKLEDQKDFLPEGILEVFQRALLPDAKIPFLCLENLPAEMCQETLIMIASLTGTVGLSRKGRTSCFGDDS